MLRGKFAPRCFDRATTGTRRWAAAAAAEENGPGIVWVRRLGMFAGALLGPVAFSWLTYFDDHRDVFRPEYSEKNKAATVFSDGEGGTLELVPKPSLGGPFRMRDARTSQEVNEVQVLGGKWTLLYFGFTKCAEICPNTMKFIVGVMDEVEKVNRHEFPRDVEDLQAVFVTIDTVRDGPKELNQFLARFRKDRRNLIGLYGDDEHTADMAKAWRVYFTSLSETPEEEEARKKRGFETLRDAISADDSYQFDHSAACYFIGPDGKLRDFFFREMGHKHAVDRIGLHWADGYGFGNGKADAKPSA